MIGVLDLKMPQYTCTWITST